MAEVKVRKGASIEGALKKLKKQMMIEGIISEVQERRYYEKPSRKKYKQRKNAKFMARVRAKYDY